MSDAENHVVSAQENNIPKDNQPQENKESIEPELLSRVPPEAKKILEIGMMSMQQRIGPKPSPFAEKINEKHIDKILEIAEKDDQRSFEDSKESRKYTLRYVLVFAVLFVFSTIYLVSADKELYKEVVKLFAVFFGGFGSGFGIKSYIDRNK
jgi:hypothetical protein